MVAVTTTPTNVPDPLMEPHPEVDADQAMKLLAEHWDAEGELTPLHGERDLNFRVATPSGARFVLKIQNPADTVGVLGFQTDAVRHIRRVAPLLPVSDVVATRSGRDWEKTTDALGRRCFVRLLTFLDGHNPDREELDADDLFAWGRTAAEMGRALRGFFHAEAGYAIAWDVKRLPAAREWASVLPDEPRRAVLEVVRRHEESVAAVLPGLRAQVVHNDLSRENVLVDDDRVITGITDFGDMTHTPLVCDLAVAIGDVIDGRSDGIRLAESMIAGYVSVTPLESREAELLADLVAARCALGVVIPAWRHPKDAGPPPVSPDAWQFLSDLLAEGLDHVSARFAAAAQPVPYRRRSTVDLQAVRGRTLGPLSLSYTHPVHLVSGRGVELYDADGRMYVDAYNNVPVLGHSHPAVAEAVGTQLRLLNTNTRYLQDAPLELAERLIESVPGRRLERVLLVNSGSEANDLAWRIARFATGRRGGIVTGFAYHGVTEATTALSPETWAERGPRPAHIRLVDAPNGGGSSQWGTVADAVAGLESDGLGTAAIFVDGVFTSDGVRGPAPAWTKQAVAAVHAAGGLYVADEVQAGYGRTGDHLWSFAADGLEADLVTLGKPMGNGYPVAAVLGGADLIDAFIAETGYFSTFGGSTAACAAALAVLRTVEAEGLTANAQAVGGYLRDLLGQLAGQTATIAPPRAWGLSLGVDVGSADTGAPSPEIAARLVDRMRERGILIGRTGPTRSALKIRPPLVFARTHADRLVAELAASSQNLDGSG
jgi:4-aminobutyrate aminotransferase-like enzyme/Ser/Thr protein kinase RdoA (MazF antagonist)